MRRRVIFGWHLDGPHFPESVAVGSLSLGPIGLINRLALCLGRLRPFAPQAVRIADYASSLRSFDDGNRFYSQSFQTDSWGTAVSLLRLRDDAIAAGWQAQSNAIGQSDRLRDLALLEATLSSRLLSVNDLPSSIAADLERGAKVPIDTLTLVDRFDHLPPIWQRILRLLERNGVEVSQLKLTPRVDGSDLAKLGASLASYSPRCDLSGDGTFVIGEADDEVQAADLLTSLLQAHSWQERNTVIIRGDSTSFLDQLLHKAGLPKVGSNLSSSQRSFLQLLPLSVELCWRPLAVDRYIEFLLLPDCPIPRFVADCFISALRRQPGIGGSAWREAWLAAAERKRSALINRGQLESAAVEEQVQSTLSEWRQWLEPPLCTTDDGLPADVAVSVCSRVRQYALSLHATRGRDIFASLAALAQTLALSVEGLGTPLLVRAQLERIMSTVMLDGLGGDEPQASAWTPVDHPGQIFAPVGSVIWWGFTSAGAPPAFNPWTNAEIDFFAKAGVVLEEPATKMIREAEAWRRPAVAPAAHLLLIRPRTVAGREVASHPFYHELAEYLERASSKVRSKIVVQAHHIYRQPKLSLIGREITRSESVSSALPSNRPVWQVGGGTLTPRAESASSLERMLGCPLNWTLRYPASIRLGDLLSISDGERLSGNLAHAVFADIFARADASTASAEFAEMAATVFEELCAKEAAPLLQPGKSLERSRLKRAICDGALELLEMIRAAGFEKIECEQEHHSALDDLDLSGRTDMILSGPGQDDYILDLKWARKSLYRWREMSEGRAIQLAVYSWLCQDEEKTAGAGYYMIAQKQLLSSTLAPFPKHTFVAGESLFGTFQKLMASYRQHMTHLMGGTIYATGVVGEAAGRDERLSDAEPVMKAQNVPGVDLVLEPPCRFCQYGRLCGVKEFA